MATGKWITEITPETATLDAARRVLGLRLTALRDAVGEIFRDRDESLEDIHQLRVASRRASAALEIFEPCLSRKSYRTAAKRLRSLRRAAGQARDFDVQIMQYTRRLEKAEPDEIQALDLLCGYALAGRIPAQAQLQEACAGYPFEFERWMTETVSALANPPREIAQVGTLGRRHLNDLCERISRAIDSAAPSYKELHSVRIVGKRLRYAMEIFADCFPKPFREELYPQVAELQEILGLVTDSHIGLERTEGLSLGLTQIFPTRAPRWVQALERLAADLKRQQALGLEQLEAWKAKAQSTGFEVQFKALLATSSGVNAVEPIRVAQAS